MTNDLATQNTSDLGGFASSVGSHRRPAEPRPGDGGGGRLLSKIQMLKSILKCKVISQQVYLKTQVYFPILGEV